MSKVNKTVRWFNDASGYGGEVEWEEGLTVARLLERISYAFSYVIVAVNGEMVPSGKLSTYAIPPGAEVLLVHVLAGG